MSHKYMQFPIRKSKRRQIDQNLINAVSDGEDYERIKSLLEEGAKVNVNKGRPLIYASCDIRYGARNAKLLLEYGANIHAENEKPLRLAGDKFRDNIEFVKVLLDHSKRTGDLYNADIIKQTWTRASSEMRDILDTYSAAVNL